MCEPQQLAVGAVLEKNASSHQNLVPRGAPQQYVKEKKPHRATCAYEKRPTKA